VKAIVPLTNFVHSFWANNDESIFNHKEFIMADKLTYKEVWETLSKVDCSEHIEKKMNLSYLSWAWAFGTLMEHYADATFEFGAFTTAEDAMHDAMFYPDGSASVFVTVDIQGLKRSMWLPVMDNRNNAISNPSSRQISDAKMRCLVKCIALFGLGHYIYAGEDLPSSDKETTVKKVEEVEEVEDKETKADTSESVLFNEAFIKFLEMNADTVENLESYFVENKSNMAKLKKELPDLYTGLIKLCAEKKQQLIKAENQEEKTDG